MVAKKIYPNIITYNVLIDALCKRKRLKEAKNVLDVMLKACVRSDIFTFNSLMNGYYLVNEVKNAKHAFYVMTQMGVTLKVCLDWRMDLKEWI